MPDEPVPKPTPHRNPATFLPVTGRLLLGAGVLTGCFLAGDALRGALGLKVPGNMLGMFLLLAGLGSGVIKLRWVETAAGALLGVLPLLFVPIFVVAARDRSFWVEHGALFSGAILVGLLALYAVVGHLGQWLFARSPGSAHDPGPLTDAEQKRADAIAAAAAPEPSFSPGGPRP